MNSECFAFVDASGVCGSPEQTCVSAIFPEESREAAQDFTELTVFGYPTTVFLEYTEETMGQQENGLALKGFFHAP